MDQAGVVVTRMLEILGSSATHPHLIGVAIERSVNYVAAVIGIIKCECAFFTLDPPDAEGMLSDYTLKKCRDYGVSLVVSTTEVRNLDACNESRGFYFAVVSSFSDLPVERRLPVHKRTADQICYAIQTSGSTGEPKIVHVPLRAIQPNIFDFSKRFEIDEHSRVLFSTNLFFDPSVVEMMLAIRYGAELIILPAGWQADNALFERFFSEDGAHFDFVQLTPTVLQRFRPEFLRRLLGVKSPVRNLLIGGEPFPLNLICHYRSPHCTTQIYNIYGVTEVSAWASCHRLAFHRNGQLMAGQNPVPIGDPLLSTRFVVGVDGLLRIFGQRKCFVNFDFADRSAVFITSDRVALEQDELSASQAHIVLISRQEKPNGILSFAGEVENLFMRHFSRISFAKLVFVKNCAYLFINCTDGGDLTANSQLRKRINVFCAHGRLPSRFHVRRIFFDLPLDGFVTLNGKIDKVKLKEYCREELRSTVSAASSSCRDAWTFLVNLYEDFKQIPLKNENLTAPLRTLGLGSLEIAELAFFIEDSMKKESTYSFLEAGGDPTSVIQLLFDDRRTNLSTLLRIIEEVFLSKSIEHELNPTDSQRRETADVNDQESENDMIYVEGKGQVIVDEEWSKYMGKCVDASPLHVLAADSRDATTSSNLTYVGSHAGRFRCFNTSDGSELLSFDEPNGAAIEAKCAAGRRFIAFGTLAGGFYVFKRSSHQLFGQLMVGSEIRASPTILVGKRSEVVAFAGYDGFLRVFDVPDDATALPSGVRLDVSASEAEFGLIRAAPFLSRPLDDDKKILAIVGTLSGYVISFDVIHHNRLWSAKLDGPIFADLIVLPANSIGFGGLLVVATVKGTIYFLDTTDGKTKFVLSLPSVAIFDAPTVVNNNGEMVLLVANGNQVFALSERRGNCLVWDRKRIKLKGLENFSTVRNPIAIDRRAFLLSTDGRLVSFPLDGSLPQCDRLLSIGEPTFGSPIVLRLADEHYRILMGTRADRLRCFSIRINR